MGSQAVKLSKEKKMKDAIGQEVKVGDTIIHCGGHYASAKQYVIVGITAKMIQVGAPDWYDIKKVSLRPDTVINITANIAILNGQNVLATVEELEREVIGRYEAGLSSAQDSQLVDLSDNWGTLVPINQIDGYEALLGDGIGENTKINVMDF